MIKVLLVDDQVLFVESLKIVLQTLAKDIRVVGTAYDGQPVLDLVRRERPDVVLMDVRMPGVNGVECTRAVKARHPATAVVMLTTFDDDDYVIDALRVGASGYLLKDVAPAEIIAAVRAVCQGGVMISPRVAARLAGRASHEGPRSDNGQRVGLEELSPRERSVLEMICRGHNNREIADLLGIGEQTVKNHVSTIYSKLGVRDRVQALRLAIDAGLEIPQNRPDG